MKLGHLVEELVLSSIEILEDEIDFVKKIITEDYETTTIDEGVEFDKIADIVHNIDTAKFQLEKIKVILKTVTDVHKNFD
jgi:hypothetical protein